MADVNLRTLIQPFPKTAIKQRQGGGGKSLSYVETHTVIHRLNDATTNCWDFRLTRLDQVGDLYVAVGELTIPGLGTRTGIGVQRVSERAGEDLVKGAASDCLKKCATLFGVGIELYGPDYEAGEGTSQTIPANVKNGPGRDVESLRVQNADAPDKSRGDGTAPSTDGTERTPGGATKRSLNYSLVLAEEAGVSDDDVHRWCGDQFGKVSRNDLDQRQMSTLIEWLQGLKEAVGEPKPETVDLDHDENGKPLSWTGFWTAVRSMGIQNAAQYEAKVGAKQTAYASPAAALAALQGSEQQ